MFKQRPSLQQWNREAGYCSKSVLFEGIVVVVKLNYRNKRKLNEIVSEILSTECKVIKYEIYSQRK